MTSDDRMRIRVDLPDPLAPISPKISPRAMSNDTSCTARTRRRGFFDHGRCMPGVNDLETPRTTRGGAPGWSGLSGEGSKYTNSPHVVVGAGRAAPMIGWAGGPAAGTEDCGSAVAVSAAS